MRALLLLVAVSIGGCGNVTADPPGAGGAGGEATTAGAGGKPAGSAGAGGELAGQGGAGGAASCLPDTNVQGFAYNAPCDASIVENASNLAPWLSACRAGCMLNGAQFVGCSVDPRVDAGVVVCRSSCSSCP